MATGEQAQRADEAGSCSLGEDERQLAPPAAGAGHAGPAPAEPGVRVRNVKTGRIGTVSKPTPDSGVGDGNFANRLAARPATRQPRHDAAGGAVPEVGLLVRDKASSGPLPQADTDEEAHEGRHRSRSRAGQDDQEHRGLARAGLHNRSIASIDPMASEQMPERGRELEDTRAAGAESDRRLEEMREQMWQCSTQGCSRPRAIWSGRDGSSGKYASCCRTCGYTGGSEHGPRCGHDVSGHHYWAESCDPHPALHSYQCRGGPEAYIVPNGAWFRPRRRDASIGASFPHRRSPHGPARAADPAEGPGPRWAAEVFDRYAADEKMRSQALAARGLLGAVLGLLRGVF